VPGAPPKDERKPFETLSLFDLVREVNTQAGRLAALEGLLVAAVSFSLSNGPIHEVLSERSLPFWLFIALLFTGANVMCAIATTDGGMEPVMALPIDDEIQWAILLMRKQRYTFMAGLFVIAFAGSLFGAWVVAAAAASPSAPVVAIDVAGYVFVLPSALWDAYLICAALGILMPAPLGRWVWPELKPPWSEAASPDHDAESGGASQTEVLSNKQSTSLPTADLPGRFSPFVPSR
jgi:hypothetical protein